MEDSTATTIDYLRARLLAERSVSRTARQRAYELEKRVTELEKQLKFVSQQRKKAEKATVDVLAILENHGRNDLSEPFDSSSDHEEMCSDIKDVEKSKHVEVQESDTEGFSGSESSSVNGRSLSWKSSKKSSSRFPDKKYIDASRRRRNSFTSTGSSPRRVGKSCRQIRHREHRSQNDDATNGHREDEGQTSSEGVRNCANVATETSLEEVNIHEEKDPLEVSTSSCNGGHGHAIQNHGTERDMERALEQKAQFIAQYEEEEKAQREWEDKYNENNGSTPDSCDPGTHSDVTEERDEIKAPARAPHPPPPCSTDQLASRSQEIDPGVVNANCSDETKIDSEPLPGQKNGDMNNEASDNQNHPPDLQGTPGNFRPSHMSSSQDNSLLYRGEQTSGKSYELTLETQNNPDKLGSVLEALQQAKLSLKQNLDKFPLLENGPSIPSYRPGDKFPVPFSSAAGLFRLPIDYEYGGTTTRANSLTYDSRLSLTNYPTDPSGGQFISSSPYRESPLSRSTTSLDDRFRIVPTFPYQQTMPEIPKLPLSSFNPKLDMHPSARDPRFDMGPSARDPRLDMGPSARDPRLDVGMGPSALDPRLGVGPSSLDPRLGLGQSALDPQLGVGRSALDPRLGLGPFDLDPRLGVGLSAFDPRLEIGAPFRGDRYGTLPGGDMPLQTRSLYDDYTRPDTYQ